MQQVTPEFKLEETHISSVYIGQSYVYKFKKEVSFDFLDYSSALKRWQACCAELDLNKRLSSGVYLGLVAARTKPFDLDSIQECWISPDNAAPRLPFGCEFAVVMRKLDLSNTLRELALAGRELDNEINLLANVLLDFHHSHQIKHGDFQAYINQLGHWVSENFETILLDLLKHFKQPHQVVPIIQNLEAFSLASLKELEPILAQRFDRGCYVEGHGDLRLEHICFEFDDPSPKIQIIDCVEFNHELRRLDYAADLAFTLMELDLVRRNDLHKLLLDSYLRLSSDPDLSLTLPLLLTYRALVRAKVLMLKARQLQSLGDRYAEAFDRSLQLISLASSYLYQRPTKQAVIVCGLMGTGKSTLAQSLAWHLYAQHLNSDVIRKQLFPETTVATKSGYNSGIYSQQASDATYAELERKALQILQHEEVVILDASFHSQARRRQIFEAIRSRCAEITLIECVLPREEQMNRLEKRYARKSSVSDGRPELRDIQASRWDVIDYSEAQRHIRLDMRESSDALSERVLKEIYSSD